MRSAHLGPAGARDGPAPHESIARIVVEGEIEEQLERLSNEPGVRAQL